MDALADVEALPSYSPAYKRAEVVDRYEDGRPHHVRIAVKVLGPIHRTEVGGVRLGVPGLRELVAAVRDLRPLGEACLVQPVVDGVEVLVGAWRDPALGPFVMVAPGGVGADLYGERAIAPAPCDGATA